MHGSTLPEKGTTDAPKIYGHHSGETVEQVARHTVRWTSIIVLVVSFIGAIVAINGRWPAPLYDVQQLSLIVIIGGLIRRSHQNTLQCVGFKNKIAAMLTGTKATRLDQIDRALAKEPIERR